MARLRMPKLCSLALLFAAPCSANSFLKRPSGSLTSAFEDYVRRHQRTYTAGTEEWESRRRLFAQSLAMVERQNANPERLWTAGVTRLSDRTPGEIAALKGYSRGGRPEASASAVVALLSEEHHAIDTAMPSDFTWASKLQATSEVQDQAHCGSCWAFSSSTVLRAHSELFQKDRKFSVQQIVSCTPNPNECGGAGGCKGATAELAMDYVFKNGCQTSTQWAYDGTDTSGKCPESLSEHNSSQPARPVVHAPFSAASAMDTGHSLGQMGGLSFGMRGYRRLPENQLTPVMVTLVQTGPVVVSLAAGREWGIYMGGIMDACQKDAIIDHAVVLLGFGVGKEGNEKNAKYWHIQNSWGKFWGEDGYIRLGRHDNMVEREYCGMDRQPEVGSGCKGGPPEVKVCGSCGLLYDVVVPEFELGEHGLWSSKSFLERVHEGHAETQAAKADKKV